MSDQKGPGVVVGFAAEARVASALGWPVAIGGGASAGAKRAAALLVAQGVPALVSFGLAGGLDPALTPGTLLVPARIQIGLTTIATDAALNERLGGMTPHLLLAGDAILATVEAKRQAWIGLGVGAVDLETAAVAEVAAEAGLPFAVLRAVCDPASRLLPAAALIGLDAAGGIALGQIVASLARDPRQLTELIVLAADAMRARNALRRRVRLIASLEAQFA